MCKGLHSIVWFLVALFVCGCGVKKQADDPILVKNIEPQLQLLESTDQNERHNHSFIALSGEIVLGPVVAGHSLELVLYTDQLVELAKPTIDSQGSYTAKIDNYDGVIIAKLVDLDDSGSDYVDEATGMPKSLGGNVLLSTTDLSSRVSNSIDLHVTPLTSLAANYAGVKVESDGSLSSVATKTSILKANKTDNLQTKTKILGVDRRVIKAKLDRVDYNQSVR